MKKENVAVERVFMSSNYFALFDISPAFNISFDELEQKYIELSKKFHPDVNKGKFEDIANINKAYEVLKSPLKRAEYLLDFFDVENKGDYLDSKILNESMEIREYLLDCDDLQFANRMIDEKIKDSIKNISNAFTKKKFGEAAAQVMRLKYLYKSSEEIKKNATDSNL
ncbi:MAG: Co-chaperone protein HscB [Wolbachia endosymbiont of Ctenocephalides orientis wCori]|nr:MAG: Co-chaperone protein HscB [Wolbachia endosymbiont of Ctenocephalides orientis wCori]